MEAKKLQRLVSVPGTEKRVHFQRQISTEALGVPRKPVIRHNTVAGTSDGPKKATIATPSTGGGANLMDELIECPICFERLSSPKMLPCQHTFCQACLETITKEGNLTCPSCNLSVTLSGGVEALPANLYLNSLLVALAQRDTKLPEISPQPRCAGCQMVGANHTCKHCQQLFCGVCWPRHVTELRSQLGALTEQLQGATDRLKHRTLDFKDRCEKLREHINEATEARVAALRAQHAALTDEAHEIERRGDESASQLRGKLATAESNVSFLEFDQVAEESEKVNLFLVLHKATSELLTEVNRWNESRPAFDRETFRIHRQEEGGREEDVDNEEGDEGEEDAEAKRTSAMVSSPDGLSLHYRSRNFTTARLNVSRSFLQRPGGVAVPPWDSSLLYVAGTDSHNVVVMDRARGRLVTHITAKDMLCPQDLAFSANRLYVTDKWTHRVLVFDREGVLLTAFGKRGDGMGQFRSPEGICVGPNAAAVDEDDVLLYVADTGNDRLQILRAKDGSFVRSVGQTADGKGATELNQPTGVAIGESKLVISDCGNRRIKVYTLNGSKRLEFGSHGGGRGQFRSPEVVAVDRMGFILVGDSGNARLQIFRPNGNLVRTIGGFGWISGLTVTEAMDIVVTDAKLRSVQIF